MTKPGRPCQRTCARGHRLTDANVYVHPSSGDRQCLTCKREHDRETKRRRRSDDDYREHENARRRERYASDPDVRAAETKRKQEYRRRTQ
jgi:hypothetical protein